MNGSNSRTPACFMLTTPSGASLGAVGFQVATQLVPGIPVKKVEAEASLPWVARPPGDETAK